MAPTDEEALAAPGAGAAAGAQADPLLEDDNDNDAEAPAVPPPAAAVSPAAPFAPPQAAAFPMMTCMHGAASTPFYPAAPGWPGTMMTPPMPYAVSQVVHGQAQATQAQMPPGFPPFPIPGAAAAATNPMAVAQGGAAAAMMPATAMGGYPMMTVTGGTNPPTPQAATSVASPAPQAAVTPAPPPFFGNGQQLAVPANFNLNTLTGTAAPPDESALGELLSEKEKKKRRKKRKDKPKRPLSAYNLFFRDERNRILEEIPDKDGKKAAAKHENGADQDTLPPPLDGDDDDAPEDNAQSQPQGSAKRKTPHGKIGFESLAKTIGGRWKELSTERLEHYKKLADADTDRYAREMEEFSKKIESEKEAALAGATDQGMPMDLASAAAAARGARQEAQRIADTVGKGLLLPPASDSSAAAVPPSTYAGEGRQLPPPAKKKRGRRPRDSLLDPEALATWTQQCQQAVTGANAAAAAAEAARQAQQAFYQAGNTAVQPPLQVPAAAQAPAATTMIMPTAPPGAQAIMMPAATPGAPAMMMVPGAMAVAMPMQPGAMAMPYPAAWPMAPPGMSPMAAAQQGTAVAIAAPASGDSCDGEDEKPETAY